MDNIQNAVAEAKDKFKFNEITGNIFEHITKNNDVIKKFSLLILKENIGKLSGFIAYPDEKYTLICINYNRSLGHQNFTLAHELGHYFLHHKQGQDDENAGNFNFKNPIEYEADKFASELLYPEKLFEYEYENIIKQEIDNLEKLSDIVNNLCHKYYVSYEFLLRKICYKARLNYDKISKSIKKLRNGSIGNYYDKEFYLTTSGASYYKRFEKPYIELKANVKELVKQKKIGEAMGESIIYSNNLTEEYCEIFDRYMYFF